MHKVFETLAHELQAALNPLSKVETQATPAGRPTAWTIQQITEHLELTYLSTRDTVAARLAKSRPTLARASLSQVLGRFFITRLGRFPGGRNSPPAVTPSRPSTLQTGQELGRRLDDALEQLDHTLRSAEILFGHQRAISHMVLGPLSVAEWRRFHLVHGRHHLRQIRTISTRPLP